MTVISQHRLNHAATARNLEAVKIGDILKAAATMAQDSGYNAVHGKADATNASKQTAPTDLATLYVFLNTLQGKINAHIKMIDPVHYLLKSQIGNRWGAAHLQADSTSAISTALAADADLATCEAFANELKAKVNTHYLTADPVHSVGGRIIEARFGAPHISPDTNAETTANATDAATGYALANSLKAKHNAHCAKLLGIHHVADATNTVSSADADDEAKTVTLANELKADFNAHMADLTHGHFQADGLTSLITTADATNFASAWTLLNVCKTTYNAHIGQAFIQPAITALVTSADATDQASLNTLTGELLTDINAHKAYTPMHVQADGQANVTGTADSLDNDRTILRALRTVWNNHVANALPIPIPADTDSTTVASDLATSITLCNALKGVINTHMADATLHVSADLGDVVAGTAAGVGAAGLASCIEVGLEVETVYDAHIAKEAAPTTSTIDLSDVL